MSETLKWRLAQGLEIRWWKKYLDGKDVDAYLAWKRDYWNKFLASLEIDPNDLVGQKILDAGCGPAGIFTVLNQSAVTCVDPLIDQYEKKLAHFSRSDYPDVHFVNATLEEFSIDEKYNSIFCLNAINHVSDLSRAMDNLFRLLSPGSQLILSIDCHKYQALKYLFRWIPGDALHPHQDDLNDYKRMVQARSGVIKKEVLSKRGSIFDYHVLVVQKTS